MQTKQYFRLQDRAGLESLCVINTRDAKTLLERDYYTFEARLGKLVKMAELVAWYIADRFEAVDSIPPSLPLCLPALRDETVAEKVKRIVDHVGAYYSLSGKELLRNTSRAARYVVPRQIAAFLLNRAGIHALEIAILFQRDRSTIQAGLKTISGRLEVDKAFRTEFNFIANKL